MRQAFRIQYALQFSSIGGKVSITCPRISITKYGYTCRKKYLKYLYSSNEGGYIQVRKELGADYFSKSIELHGLLTI